MDFCKRQNQKQLDRLEFQRLKAGSAAHFSDHA